MAYLTGVVEAFPGDTTVVDTTQQFPLLTRARDINGNEYIYLAGASSTVAGSVVTYDEVGATTLLATNAKGFIAVAQAAVSSTSYYGWYCIFGNTHAMVVNGTNADTSCGYETGAGYIGDGRAAGDEIINMMIREANATGSTALKDVQLAYAYCNDITGS